MWWWLSFADHESGQCLGCAFVEGENVVDAIGQAWDLGIDPGGDVLSIRPPKGFRPHEKYQNRLIPSDEAEAMAELTLEEIGTVEQSQ